MVLFIMNDPEEAGYFYHDLRRLTGDRTTLFFPSSYKRAIKYNQHDSAHEILRTEVMARLTDEKVCEESLFVVSYPDALAELVPARKSFSTDLIHISTGDNHDLGELERKLVDMGFNRTDYVYEPGQFAIRGSIVDIYSFTSERPYRLDFFGDEVDSIRKFEVESQLSTEKVQVMDIVPEQHNTDGKVCFLEFLPDHAIIAAKHFAFIHDRMEQIFDEGFSRQAVIDEQKETTANADADPLRIIDTIVSPTVLDQHLGRFRQLTFGKANVKGQKSIVFNTAPQPLFHKNFDLLTSELEKFVAEGYRLNILADSNKQTERLREILDASSFTHPFTAIEGTLHEGFIDHTSYKVYFTDHQIFDRFHKYSLKSEKVWSGRVALSLKEISQFEIGDYIVHIDHGIGRFGGLVRVPNSNGQGSQEMIKINYLDNASIYVSIHSLHKVSKYKGKEGVPPRLSKLGTGAWERMKERVKTKVKDIARDLIRLYARRRQEKGFSFSPDSFMQHELEASFMYEDTPDQLKATIDVKKDMESARPMDRLVCGDVGFGKTEIAIRAACKAAVDGKQTAVLVPTTILCYQHYQTFTQRMKDFPVRIEYLSRSRSAKATKELLTDLEAGKIDIIIGTHKLIGKDVKFHDLGLLIIDEEQKFGVSVKEKLRQLKVNVDTLTLTATPIPRTLQFSLMGARDLSAIQTPPPNRYPIQTEIHTFSAEVIADAINFEMSRNGQVFFVSNRISDLPHLEAIIHKYVPDARICIGHGRMNPQELEQVVFDFMNHDYDVMLSTTIVENGVDIPNANTIIINAAQNYGLSDLHQMRGRVGRSNRKAFCYLLAPPLVALSDDARRRLQAIESFSELGSGISIAMQDLDIRGAGNMLGAEQSGFVAELGYETYQKILSEAVHELKAEEFSQLDEEEPVASPDTETSNGNLALDAHVFVKECVVDSDLEMLFPEMYVPTSGERIRLYRELDSLTDMTQVEQYRKRLTDRFGTIPPQGEELIKVMPLKWICCRLGVEKAILKNGQLILQLVADTSNPFYGSDVFMRIIRFASTHPRQCRLSEGRTPTVTIASVKTVDTALKVLNEIEETKTA